MVPWGAGAVEKRRDAVNNDNVGTADRESIVERRVAMAPDDDRQERGSARTAKR